MSTALKTTIVGGLLIVAAVVTFALGGPELADKLVSAGLAILGVGAIGYKGTGIKRQGFGRLDTLLLAALAGALLALSLGVTGCGGTYASIGVRMEPFDKDGVCVVVTTEGEEIDRNCGRSLELGGVDARALCAEVTP